MAEPTLTQVLVDSTVHREAIRQKALDALNTSFPVKTRNFSIELANPRVEKKDVSSREQKQAILEGRSINERVRADLTVKNAQGEVVSTAKDFTLLHLPYFTPRHTFILDGTEYSVSNQIRTKAGVFTRRRGNEDLEASFNLSKGGNFRVLMEPEKGHLMIQPTHTTSKIPLYPVLRALGMPHQDIANHWGSEVAELNRDAFKNPDKHVEKFYKNFIHPSKQTHATLGEKVTALHEYLDGTIMDPDVNRATLGHGYDKASPHAMLAASRKLLDVHRSGEDTDDRDSLEFKTFHTVGDFINERIGLDARMLKGKLGLKLDNHKGDIRKALPTAPFTRGINAFLTGSSLSAVPTQINPMELIDHSVRVTSLGEGAISSERSIPLEARNLHPTHFGVMDPVRTPESFKAGIDIRAALGARRDEKGNLYAPAMTIATGKHGFVRAADLTHGVVAFPGEDVRPGKMVDVIKGGEVMRVPSSEVTHQVTHISDLYGPTTNLLPFLDGMQGNRALMASKHQSQGLSLVHREAPLVQVASWNPGKSVEQEMVRLIVPTTPVAGTVVKVDGDYIHIRPDSYKHSAAGLPAGYKLTTREDDEHPGHGVLDVHHKGENVAYLRFNPKDTHTLIDSMYVVPEHRKKGLANALLERILSADPGEFRLKAAPFKDEGPNSAALKKLYAHHGFVDSDAEGRMIRHKQASDDEFYSNFIKEGDETDGNIRIHYDDHFPLAAKSFLHNTVKVKEGDRVVAGQHLADSNFTRNDTLALGTNLSVGYMPYRGLNSNDGLVVSQGGADKLTSEHMYKYVMLLNGVEMKREKHKAYFGNKYTATQYSNLDDDGVVKPGSRVNPKDPLIAGIREAQMSANNALLGKLSKSLVRPYSEETQFWDHDHPGTVMDVVKTPQRITVTVKTEETLVVGDKLTGRYGNKGVIAKIIPNHEMIQDEHGKPIDLLFTAAGVVSRINPAQVIESALGKVAKHTGEPIHVENYAPRDNVKYAKDLLAKHGLKDKETVFDPITGRSIPGIFVGNSYILKLFKTTDSNWSSHGVDGYDFNQQPARGGDEGAKAIGRMEFDGLVAHNARNVLHEASAIKSQRNDEFWRAIQLGLPTPAPKTPFAYDKFLGMIQGAGVKVNKQGSRLSLGPLTDADITKMSSGALKEPHKIVRAKDLAPEYGGMFDPAMTGGTAGTKWSHVDLHEKIVNPVFEEPVRRLLGMTQKQFDDHHAEHGGQWFHRELGKIDIDQKIADLREQSKTARKEQLDNVVKQVKYLTALKAQKLNPQDAYVLSKIPVIPPVMRPVLPLKDGRLQIGDANLLYRDAFLANQKLNDVTGILPKDELKAPRRHLYEAVGAVFGTHDPVSPTTEKRGAKGYLTAITGTRPGNGFFQGKLMKRQQDVSGRATIAPDPTLSMDEVGMPEQMMWGMYAPFVIGRLVKRGHTALDAKKMVEDQTHQAREELILEAKERPVILNRAPSLHRFNVIGAYPKITSGKTLMLNPFAERGMGADYDGDAMQVHAPVTAAGVADVKKMTLSNLLFSDRRPGVLNVSPDMEAILGLHRATAAATSQSTKHFDSKEKALAAYHRGEIKLTDVVEIDKK